MPVQFTQSDLEGRQDGLKLASLQCDAMFGTDAAGLIFKRINDFYLPYANFLD